MTYRETEPPLEADRSVLVVGLAGRVIGVDRQSGTILWKNDLSGGGWGEVYLGLRFGVLAVSAQGGAVFRLDYATGRVLWKADTTAAGRATIVVEPDLIVVAKGGYLDAFDHDGGKRWSQKLEGMGIGAAALGFPGNVAQADTAGAK